MLMLFQALGLTQKGGISVSESLPGGQMVDRSDVKTQQSAPYVRCAEGALGLVVIWHAQHKGLPGISLSNNKTPNI